MDRKMAPFVVWVCVAAGAGCTASTGDAAPTPPVAPSDDPADWPVDSSTPWHPVVSQERFVVPSDALPMTTDTSNNNVDIMLFQDRLFMAWRTAETHWASVNTAMMVVSSTDMGQSWEQEAVIEMGSDVREPRFMVFDGALMLHWFQGGTDPLGFDPQAMWRMRREGLGQWTPREMWGQDGEIPWQMKVRNGQAFMTSYRGAHYRIEGDPSIDVYFKTSTDGTHWAVQDPAHPAVYHGGVSEVAFEFDLSGNLWGVTRNEDGDASGFGSHVCFAPAGDLSNWQCPARCSPERYDSPWMFRHGSELYLVARRDVGGPFDEGLTGMSLEDQRVTYLLDYWNRPKRTALYRIDQTNREVVHLMDLPGVGDTAFPSIRRLDAHRFVMANYTSPLDAPGISWITGQGSPRGTQIYLMEITFEPGAAP